MVFQRSRPEKATEIWDLVRKWNRGKPEKGIQQLAATIQVVGGQQDVAIVMGNRSNTLVRLAMKEDGSLETECRYPDLAPYRNFRLPPIVSDEGRETVITPPIWDLVKSLTDEAIALFISRNFSPPLKGPVSPTMEEGLITRINQFVAQVSTRGREVRNTAQEFQDRVARMTRPGVLRLITRMVWETPRHDSWDLGKYPRNKSITLWHYNTVARLGEHAEQMWRSNPGIMTWFMLNPGEDSQEEEPVNHPGQVIQVAREHMMSLGLEQRNWKFCARLEPETMRELAWAEHKDLSVWMMNRMAEGRNIPSPDIIRGAHVLCRGMDPGGQGQENFARAFRLMFRESHENPLEGQRILAQAQDLRDYVEAMNDLERRIESNSWNGIVQRSQRWHRELAEALENRQREQLVNREDGYLEWESLVEKMTVDEYTINPLTNEVHLLEEATEMKHCVAGYGSTCANGRSRIFSIHHENQHVATMEIQLKGAAWSPAQIRGKHNHAVSQAIQRAGQAVAEEYTAAWEKHPRHRSWTVRNGEAPDRDGQEE